MADLITFGGNEAPVAEAFHVLAGYCFGRAGQRQFQPRAGQAFGEAPELEPPYLWGYATYECVPVDPEPEISLRDVLGVAGLNGEITVERLNRLAPVLPAVSEALARVDVPFLEMDPDQLADPNPDGPEWFLTRAWWLMMSVPEIGPTITHKVLHRKRPEVCPLLDGFTLKAFDPGRAWVALHKEINSQRDAFELLRKRFAELAALQGTPELTLLRIYDILLWCLLASHWDPALDAGARLAP